MRCERGQLAGWAFSAPALILLTVFMALPFLAACWWSFTDERLASPLPTRWIGFEQYIRAFSSDAFIAALRNNALFALMVVPIQTALALMVAMALNVSLRGISILRAAFFAPVVYPMALVSVVWLLLLAPGPDAPINSWLHTMTFGVYSVDNDQGLLTDPWTALPAIAALSIWQGLGFQTVILLAGLQNVPDELHEAAAVDGAGRWAQFRHVTLPALRGPLTFTIMVTTILAFRLFDQVRIMTMGGPDHATTTVMYEAVRAAHGRGQVGLGAAMSVIFVIIVCAITLGQMWWSRRREAAP